MPRKSFAGKAASALWKAIKWLARGSWRAVKWLFSSLWRGSKALARKGNVAASRPKGEARFDSFELVEVEAGSRNSLEDFLYKKGKSTVGVVLGARGSGKSALGLRVLENAAARGRRVCALGFKESAVPPWVRVVASPDEASNGSFLLVDEGGISFSSRSSMSSANKLLSSLLFVARHKDLSVLFITQNSANLEVNTLRQADYLLLKKPSLLQRDFERKKINEIYDSAASGFKEHAENKGLFYSYSDSFKGFASNSLPSFWSQAASKSFDNAKLGSKRG